MDEFRKDEDPLHELLAKVEAAMPEAHKEAMQHAASISHMLIGMVNMAWQHRVAVAAMDDRLPFEKPSDVTLFIENTTIMCAGILMRDKELTLGTLKAMEVPTMVDLLEKAPWPEEARTELPTEHITDEALRDFFDL
jgi:hypothetical protein